MNTGDSGTPYKPCPSAPHEMTGEWDHNPPEIGPPDFHNWNSDGITHYICDGKLAPHPVTPEEAIEILRDKLNKTPKGWKKIGETDDGGELHIPADAVPASEVDSPQNVAGRAEIVRWADRAMFKAEPVPDGGPRVYLLWCTPDPLGAIAAACKMYKGEVVRDLSEVTDEERIEYFEQVQKTKLKAPFEFVKFHFLIEGVTRAFTHQMVRQRTAVYAQESLRFAVVGGEDTPLPVGLPPSLSGTDGADAKIWSVEPGDDLTPAERMRLKWNEAINTIDESYGALIDMGMPAEDARGLLPHNTLTRLHYSTDLRALLDHAGNRLCTQAQMEWRLVFAKIIEAIRGLTCSNRGDADGMLNAYMADKLVEPFKPVCYQQGSCAFMAEFDRDCSIRNRVQANHDIGRSSSEWGAEHDKVDPLDVVSGVGEKSVVRTADNRPVFIGAIKPGEWLLDPGAARRKAK